MTPPAPDPGGSELATISVPHAGAYVGFNDDVTRSLNGAAAHGLTPAEYIRLTRNLGGNAIRTTLDWRRVERTKGKYAWEPFDEVYWAATNAAVTPIFILAFAPVWARDPAVQLLYPNPDDLSRQYPPTREMNSKWTQFATLAATRYPGAIFEIWNEPNFTTYWQSGVDPQRYAELQALAYKAIKAVNPNALVLSAGFACPPDTKPNWMALREFVQRAYAAAPSIRGHMDALNFHPYPTAVRPLGYTDPLPALGAGSEFARMFDDVRVARAQAGDTRTRLFITETGVATPAGQPAPEVPDDQTQASGMMRLYRRVMSMTHPSGGPDVLGVLFHRLIEPKDSMPTPNVEWGYAWLRYGTTKPLTARCVYTDFVSAAGGKYP